MPSDIPPHPSAAPVATSAIGALDQRLAAIGFFMLALACFCVLDAGAKWLNPHVGPLMVTWVRYVVSVACVAVFLNPWTTPGVSVTKKPWMQGARSLLLFGSTICNFLALQHLQLAQTMSIMFLVPLVIALLAGPLMNEWVGPRRLAAIGVGFVGILLVARPGFGGIHPAALFSVGAVFCNAAYVMLTRVLAAHDSSSTTMFYSGFAGVILLTPLLPFVWVQPQDGLVLAVMLLIGACGALGHWLFILAFRRAPASILAPFGYAQIIVMIALGYVIFGDVPDGWTLCGASIVIASGLYLLHRERVTGLAATGSRNHADRS
jgi:drug/metabolite transporter (DMT)-like permease